MQNDYSGAKSVPQVQNCTYKCVERQSDNDMLQKASGGYF